MTSMKVLQIKVRRLKLLGCLLKLLANVQCTSTRKRIGHFAVMDGSEAEGDPVLIQTFFALLWKFF